MNTKNSLDINNLVRLTEDFINFIAKLYDEGTINREQYETMTSLKREFLSNTKVKS